MLRFFLHNPGRTHLSINSSATSRCLCQLFSSLGGTFNSGCWTCLRNSLQSLPVGAKQNVKETSIEYMHMWFVTSSFLLVFCLGLWEGPWHGRCLDFLRPDHVWLWCLQIQGGWGRAQLLGGKFQQDPAEKRRWGEVYNKGYSLKDSFWHITHTLTHTQVYYLDDPVSILTISPNSSQYLWNLWRQIHTKYLPTYQKYYFWVHSLTFDINKGFL